MITYARCRPQSRPSCLPFIDEYRVREGLVEHERNCAEESISRCVSIPDALGQSEWALSLSPDCTKAFEHPSIVT